MMTDKVKMSSRTLALNNNNREIRKVDVVTNKLRLCHLQIVQLAIETRHLCLREAPKQYIWKRIHPLSQDLRKVNLKLV